MAESKFWDKEKERLLKEAEMRHKTLEREVERLNKLIEEMKAEYERKLQEAEDKYVFLCAFLLF